MAQNILLPNGEQTFLDNNGDPLSGGKVYTYVPGTTTPSNTFQDEGLTVANPNPIILDQGGRCIMWGANLYRQVVYDQFGNEIWDRVTGEGPLSGLDITGDLNITGNINTTGNITGNNITATGSLTVDGNFVTYGTGFFAGDFSTAGNFTAAKDVTVEGILHADTIDCGGAGITSFGCPITAVDGATPPVGYAGYFETIVYASTSDQKNYVKLTAQQGILAITSATPSVALQNPNNGIFYGFWANDTLNFGTTDSTGKPGTVTLKTDTQGNFYPNNPGGGGDQSHYNLGVDEDPWNDVVAHAYITVSTNAASPEIQDGCLEIVKKTPVKTAPHIGISHFDANSIEGATKGSGTNYNVLVGVLWKAVQELSAELAAMKAAGAPAS